MQYVLVHGSWQGGWCWQELLPYLNKKGHQVACPDLPGHGNHSYPLAQITYELYYTSLLDEIKKYKEPIVLVAHSMSGMLAAPLLDRYPDLISHLFLIAAYVPQKGRSLIDIAEAGGPSVIPSLLLPTAPDNTVSLEMRKVREGLYHDCSPEIATWAMEHLQPQPMKPLTTPIAWIDSGKTKHKRTYIFCEEDRDVHPITQQLNLDDYPCNTIKLKAGHFPFLSQPEILSEILA